MTTKIDLGKLRMNWRGPYDATASYEHDDVVSYQGSSFIAKKKCTGVTPAVGEHWDLLAAGTDQLTTKGDLLIHDGDKPIRLPGGNNHQVLQMVEGQPAWQNETIDPSRRVWKLAKTNGMGCWHTRVYLMADGTIKASGYGGNHANGDPNAWSNFLPIRVAAADPGVKFVEVFSGGLSNYALTADGEVWSWGWNNRGQLGHNDTSNRAVATRIEYFVENAIKIRKVIPCRPNYYDYGGVYFLTTDGRVYFCGYNNTGGNAGNGTATQYIPAPVRCGSLENITDVAASGLPYSAYAINEAGDLWVWGWNHYGQLGLGHTTNLLSPLKHTAINNVAKAVVSAGYRTDGKDATGHALVLKKDGTLWSTGYNGYGNLGLGDTTNRTSFAQITHTASFIDIFSGDGRYPSCGAIEKKDDKTYLHLWGYNGYGQLGTGAATNVTSPLKPEGDFQGKVTKAVFGGGASYEGCILEADGKLWAAGYSTQGNLGYSLGQKNPTFSRVLGQSSVIKEWGVFGQGTAYWGLGVLYDDGRVDACGNNEAYGETGTQPSNLHDVGILTNVIF